jgi:hypothetical protein
MAGMAKFDQNVAALRTWGKIGRQLDQSQVVEWVPVTNMLSAAAPLFKALAEESNRNYRKQIIKRQLLRRWQTKVVFPLPFASGFGAIFRRFMGLLFVSRVWPTSAVGRAIWPT